MTKIDNELTESNKVLEGKAPQDELPFGVMLKAAREKAGYSIERAAMATRISQPFVEALEQGAVEKLPGAVFGRGFIRNLCKAYGIDSAEILAAFDVRTNAVKGKDISLSSRDEKRHQQLKKGVLLIQTNEWKGRIKALAPHHYLRAKPLIMLVAAVLFVGLLLNQFDLVYQNDDDQLAVDSRKTTEIAEPTPAPVENKEVIAASSAPVVNAPAPAALPPAPIQTPPPAAIAAEKIDGLSDLELRVKEPVIVKITKDQDKQFSGELKADTYRYRFKDQVKVYIEDISVVEIYFKGQRVPTSMTKGESKRMTFQSSEGQIAKKAITPPL
jgi:cytoskeletal protein RodZ